MKYAITLNTNLTFIFVLYMCAMYNIYDKILENKSYNHLLNLLWDWIPYCYFE